MQTASCSYPAQHTGPEAAHWRLEFRQHQDGRQHETHGDGLYAQQGHRTQVGGIHQKKQGGRRARIFVRSLIHNSKKQKGGEYEKYQALHAQHAEEALQVLERENVETGAGAMREACENVIETPLKGPQQHQRRTRHVEETLAKIQTAESDHFAHENVFVRAGEPRQTQARPEHAGHVPNGQGQKNCDRKPAEECEQISGLKESGPHIILGKNDPLNPVS